MVNPLVISEVLDVVYWLQQSINLEIVNYSIEFSYISFEMTWYMNFCAPFIPNDPTINFHRYLQTSLLALYTLVYAILHIYYQFCNAPEEAPPQQSQTKKQQKKQKQSDSDAPDSSEQSSQKSKQVSIKIDEQANESCVQLRKTGSTWGNTTKKNSAKGIAQPFSLEELQSYFPIVYGHFAIAMGLSIMYSPYAEQSIASLLYMVLTIPLMILNSKRYQKSTRAVWIIMAILLVYIFTCGLLEVGQSNWDYINLTCFSNQYVSFYG